MDGAGARASGNALAYVLWLTFIEGIPFLALDPRAPRTARHRLHPRAAGDAALLGGCCSVAAYAIVLWAMTRAPIAAVAALRETSVLFAALIGAVLLKEGFGLARLVGAASVVAGVAALQTLRRSKRWQRYRPPTRRSSSSAAASPACRPPIT